MPTPDIELAILRQNRQLAHFNQEAAARRQEFHLMASEGERIAWLQRRIDELETRAGGAALGVAPPEAAAHDGTPPGPTAAA